MITGAGSDLVCNEKLMIKDEYLAELMIYWYRHGLDRDCGSLWGLCGAESSTSSSELEGISLKKKRDETCADSPAAQKRALKRLCIIASMLDKPQKPNNHSKPLKTSRKLTLKHNLRLKIAAIEHQSSRKLFLQSPKTIRPPASTRSCVHHGRCLH